VERARGKIYTAELNRLDLPKVKEQYPITSMVSMGNHVNIRFISEDAPIDMAIPCEANVEDAYMYLMQQKRGEM
jgi:ABC-2 type transport system ATP-binding protein